MRTGRLGKYKPDDNMIKLISDNYPILLIMSRFGISLGFGEKTVGEVCNEAGVDTETFLTVVNMLTDNDAQVSIKGVSVESLVSYLHNSHDYFLKYKLPAIRNELINVLDMDTMLAKAVVKYFDEYVAEVQQHMSYEENQVFPYVRALLCGERNDDYRIDVFRKQHDQVEARLTEFKNILIKYYPARSTNEVNNVLFDIFNCERDLASHNYIEDRLFVPLVTVLEKETPKRMESK